MTGLCLSCGLAHRPVDNGRCDLCAAAFGPASQPEHLAMILARVTARLLPSVPQEFR